MAQHKHPIAAVYKITNLENDLIYIGESGDIVHRFNIYNHVPRKKASCVRSPIERAIREYGIASFSFEVLESSKKDPDLVDIEYRRVRETYYIDIYDATNPEVGYNRVHENHANYYTNQDFVHCGGWKHDPTFELKTSKPIIAYNPKDDSILMYIGAKSFQCLHGITDRSIVSNAIKHGRTCKGQILYKLDLDIRREDAERNIRKKSNADGNGSINAYRSLRLYIKGLQAVNEWCEFFEFPTLDFQYILDEIPDLDHLLSLGV